MAHHKRGRPKHQRAGCLYCKPHKDERGTHWTDIETASNRRKIESMEEQIEEFEENGPVVQRENESLRKSSEK